MSVAEAARQEPRRLLPAVLAPSVRRLSAWLLLCIGVLLAQTPLAAEPVKVRLLEGNTRGFLVLAPPGGKPIAHGELRQKAVGSRIESLLQFKFKDGSLYEETLVFSQRGVFRLESYRLIQRGPSFPLTDVAFDRQNGRFTARTQETKDAKEETASGPIELPEDVYNGMALTLLKNLPAGGGAAGHMVIFRPKPLLIKMALSPEGTGTARLGGGAYPVTRYLVKLEVGGLTGVFASLLGKNPPDLRYWVVSGDVPAFVGFEGAMYLNGPTWGIHTGVVELSR